MIPLIVVIILLIVATVVIGIYTVFVILDEAEEDKSYVLMIFAFCIIVLGTGLIAKHWQHWTNLFVVLGWIAIGSLFFEMIRNLLRLKDGEFLQKKRNIPAIPVFLIMIGIACILKYYLGLQFDIHEAYRSESFWILIIGAILSGVVFGLIRDESEQAPSASFVSGKSCGNCGKAVSLSSKVGDTCPHCGVVWGRHGEKGKNFLSELKRAEQTVDKWMRNRILANRVLFWMLLVTFAAAVAWRVYRINTKPVLSGLEPGQAFRAATETTSVVNV